ncbi:MAG: anti-sigma factor, partial [Candidatus Cryptobacteroides sp.]
MEKDEFIGRLPAYFDGELSPAEMLEIQAWINASPENMQEAESVRRICLAADIVATSKRIDTDKAFGNVRGKMAAARHRRIVRSVWKIAAAVCIPVVLAAAGFMFWHLGTAGRAGKVQMIEVCANPGMVSRVILPDSSRVWLNSGSRLRYPSRFGDTRDVELVGEA